MAASFDKSSVILQDYKRKNKKKEKVYFRVEIDAHLLDTEKQKRSTRLKTKEKANPSPTKQDQEKSNSPLLVKQEQEKEKTKPLALSSSSVEKTNVQPTGLTNLRIYPLQQKINNSHRTGSLIGLTAEQITSILGGLSPSATTSAPLKYQWEFGIKTAQMQDNDLAISCQIWNYKGSADQDKEFSVFGPSILFRELFGVAYVDFPPF